MIKNNILSAIRLTLVFMVFFCGIYTLAILGVSNLLNANSIENETYQNIGQAFTSDKYFWSRPSAVNYNAAGSGGSNKGPSNPEYLATVQARIDSFLAHNPDVTKIEIPSDIVTASGSGLDPNISFQAAKIQVKRISEVRKINEATLIQLIEQQLEKPLFGLFGPEKINVIRLNRMLDKLN
jgi:K+-transporting ATPase ATPase C chain